MVYGLLALAAVMFGLYNVFIKLSANHIQAVLGAVVLQFVAAFVGLGLLFYIRGTGAEPLHASVRGILLAVLAGVAIGLVEVLTFMVFSQGFPVAVANPLVVGGSLLVTTTVGVVLLRETANPLQLAAIIMIAVGIGLLALGAGRGAPLSR